VAPQRKTGCGLLRRSKWAAGMRAVVRLDPCRRRAKSATLPVPYEKLRCVNSRLQAAPDFSAVFFS
jgi:hypothetical protein